MNDADLRALTRLLDDDNPAIAEQAAALLVEAGQAALPALRDLADRAPLLAGRVARRIELRAVDEGWVEVARAPDIEAAAFLLARWHDPLLDEEGMRRHLDALAKPLAGQIPSGESYADYRRDAVALRDWLSVARDFRGNMENYSAPESVLLPTVLASRRGQPLTLSLIYLLVARRLGAPLYAIGMPSHLIVRYGSAQEGVYLDPFNQGALMSARDAQRWLAQQGLAWQPAFFEPMTDRAFILRMLRNLINALAQRGNERAVEQVQRFLAMMGGM